MLAFMPELACFSLSASPPRCSLLIVVPLAGCVRRARCLRRRGARLRRVATFSFARCHTLNRLGGNYAPDLTRIYSARRRNYLRAFLVSPGAFHPDAIRIMPRLA
ncbi:MAG: hypothetical protein U0703_12790 [Anaerolineae bacterium]